MTVAHYIERNRVSSLGLHTVHSRYRADVTDRAYSHRSRRVRNASKNPRRSVQSSLQQDGVR